jgi:hypothetical protein
VLRENNPELAHHEMEVLEVGAVVLKDTGLYLASAVELWEEETSMSLSCRIFFLAKLSKAVFWFRELEVV